MSISMGFITNRENKYYCFESRKIGYVCIITHNVPHSQTVLTSVAHGAFMIKLNFKSKVGIVG